jgi:hypothetical protein
MLGLFIGLIGAVAAARSFGDLVFAIAPTDPSTYLGVGMTLLAVATLAVYMPIRRVLRSTRRRSSEVDAMAEPRWLLLGHQLPTSSSNARVKTWRRLQQIGAVPARNSVYVLPNTDQCREDFEWIRTEIVALGGEATVFAADAISERGTDDIVSTFRSTREQEYRALKTEIDRFVSGSDAKRRPRARADGQTTRSLRVLRDRLSAIERIDFLDAPGRAEAAAALARLEETMSAQPRISTVNHGASERDELSRPALGDSPRPGVDRMASAWLIRRFIDPNATFAFTNRPEGADVPFDMYTGEFSHQGDACTFEVLADRFGLTSPAVIKVGRVVPRSRHERQQIRRSGSSGRGAAGRRASRLARR